MQVIIVAIIFNALDMVSGVLCALKKHDLHSGKLRDGLFKKCGFLLCYALAFLVDHYGSTFGLALSFSVTPVICSYVIFTEMVSIVENASRINPEIVPDKILEILHKD